MQIGALRIMANAFFKRRRGFFELIALQIRKPQNDVRKLDADLALTQP